MAALPFTALDLFLTVPVLAVVATVLSMPFLALTRRPRHAMAPIPVPQPVVRSLITERTVTAGFQGDRLQVA